MKTAAAPNPNVICTGTFAIKPHPWTWQGLPYLRVCSSLLSDVTAYKEELFVSILNEERSKSPGGLLASY